MNVVIKCSLFIMLKEPNRHDTREAILDAAERLLERFGYSKMTMNDLAEDAGIGVGTTYLYFPGKSEVAMAVLERYHVRVRYALSEIAESADSDDAKLHAMLMMRVMMRFEGARAHQGQIEDFKRAVQTIVTERKCHWLDAEAEVFAQVLARGREKGLFEMADPMLTAKTLIKATSCMMPNRLTPADFDNPDTVRAETAALVDLLLRGLRCNDAQ